MNRAQRVAFNLFGMRVNEAVFHIAGHLGFGDGGSTASTTNLEDHFRAKGYVHGREYRWISPFKLQIAQDAIDRDILDSIQSAGGVEDIEHDDLESDTL